MQPLKRRRAPVLIRSPRAVSGDRAVQSTHRFKQVQVFKTKTRLRFCYTVPCVHPACHDLLPLRVSRQRHQVAQKRVRLFILILLGISCRENPALLPTGPSVVTDLVRQKPTALVDILWVIDNSGTMRDEQANLATHFDQFIRGLSRCLGTGFPNDVCDLSSETCQLSGAPCRPPDYQIGVISTDTQAEDAGHLRQIGVCRPGPNIPPNLGKYRYCETNAECATHEHPAFDPQNLHCDQTTAVRFITPQTPDAPQAFGRLARVGTLGSGRERGFEAAARSLGLHYDRTLGRILEPPTVNIGFIRDRAALFIIFVSDEDDRSFGEPTYFYRRFETLKGVGNENLVSVSAIVGDPDLDGLEGPIIGGCEGPSTDTSPQRNSAGDRYVALSMYSRGAADQLRVCDDERLLCERRERCERPFATLPGICVPAPEEPCVDPTDCGLTTCSGNQNCMTCSDGQCQIDSSSFIALLEKNGIFRSICAQDYGPVLNALGFEIAGLDRKFQLSQTPDCVTNHPLCPTTSPLCVVINDTLVPNDPNLGWIYESSSQSIFFGGEFVPPAGSSIEIRYLTAPGGVPASRCLSDNGS